MLVQAYAVSWLDYCTALYDMLSTCCIGFINRVLHIAALLTGCILRFGRVSECMRDVLRWLSYHQRIAYWVSALVRHCINFYQDFNSSELDSALLLHHAIPVCCCLHSVAQNWTCCPCLRTANRVCCAFFVAGPATWNGLSTPLRQISVGQSIFRIFYNTILLFTTLKTVLFDYGKRAWVGNLEGAQYKTAVVILIITYIDSMQTYSFMHRYIMYLVVWMFIRELLRITS